MLYKLENIVQKYGEQVALDLRDRPPIEISKGSTLTLTGPNGAGKSTLLRLLAFLEKPSGGQIIFNGDQNKTPRLQATLLLQEPYVFKRSVMENVCYGLRLRNNTKDMQIKACEALEKVGFEAKEMLKRPWYQLSGGEKQRVALAARLALKPLALLLDEPTSHVDSKSAIAIQQAVLGAISEGTTVIVASHDESWLKAFKADHLRLEAR